MRIALFLTIFMLCASAEAADLAALEGKGVKFRKEKDGSVSEATAVGEATLTVDDYRALSELTTLKKIYLSPKGTPVNDETVPLLGKLEGLERFFANGAKFTDDGMKPFAGLKNVKYFGLDHWFGPEGMAKGTYVGAGLAHLAPLTNLEAVRLGGCKVDNSACKALAEVKSLQSIDLFHTFAVTDDGMPYLAALPALRIVKLGPQFQPRITDKTLEHLSAIPTLEEIHITETWLTYEKGLQHLKKLPKLKLLSMKLIIASEEDMAKLKADLPKVTIDWTLPEEAKITETKARFEKHWAKANAPK